MKHVNRRNILALSSATAGAVLLGGRAEAQNAAAKDAAPALGDPPPLEIFARGALVNQIALSPDGKRVAVVSQKGDQKILGYFDIADKKIHSVPMGSSKIRNIFWGDNSHVVVTASVTKILPEFGREKNELFLVQIINLDNMQSYQLFDNMERFYNITFGDIHRIKVNGEYRVTGSSYHLEDPFDLCLYSFGLPKDSIEHQVDVESVRTEGWVMTPDGVALAYASFKDDVDIAGKEWKLYLNTAGTMPPRFTQIYSVKGAKHYPSLTGLGRDGKSVIITLRNPDDDNSNFHEIGADGVLSPSLDTTPGDSEALFHPVTGRLAGFQKHDDWVTFNYFDPMMKKLAEAVPQALPPGYRFRWADFAEDPRKMIVYGESADNAGSYYFIDFSNGDTTILADDYPDLPQPWITQKQAIDYKAGDGLNIHAYLTLPPGKAARDLPLIMLPHGGPAYRDYIDFDWEAQVFASRGYAVLQPNFRGSTGYGAGFRDAGNGEWGRKMQTDLSDGIAYLAKQGIVDPKRVAIYGASYGGYAALAGATLDPPGTYRCAVDIAGISDLRGLLDYEKMDDGANYQSHLETLQKEMWGDPERYDDVSPARQAAKAYCPILIIHGTDDTRVPIDQSQRMERALKDAGKDVQFITYQGQTHWEDIASSRLAMIQASMDFIQKHNPA